MRIDSTQVYRFLSKNASQLLAKIRALVRIDSAVYFVIKLQKLAVLRFLGRKKAAEAAFFVGRAKNAIRYLCAITTTNTFSGYSNSVMRMQRFIVIDPQPEIIKFAKLI